MSLFVFISVQNIGQSIPLMSFLYMVNDMKTKQREKAKKVGKSKVVAEVIRELENLQKAKKETLYD